MSSHRYETTMVNLFNPSEEEVQAELDKGRMLTGQDVLLEMTPPGYGDPSLARTYYSENPDSTLIYRLFVHGQ